MKRSGVTWELCGSTYLGRIRREEDRKGIEEDKKGREEGRKGICAASVT